MKIARKKKKLSMSKKSTSEEAVLRVLRGKQK